MSTKRKRELEEKEKKLERIENRFKMRYWFSAYPFAYNLIEWFRTSEDKTHYNIGVDQARDTFKKELGKYLEMNRENYEKLIFENHKLEETIETLRYLDEKRIKREGLV